MTTMCPEWARKHGFPLKTYERLMREGHYSAATELNRAHNRRIMAQYKDSDEDIDAALLQETEFTVEVTALSQGRPIGLGMTIRGGLNDGEGRS